MLSEGSLPEHHVKAFDLTYSWNVYDVLEPLLQGKRLANSLDQILENEELQFPTGSLRMRFNTNHDKNAWDAPAVKKFGPKGLKLAAVLINTIPGVPMIYTGEEVGNDKRLSLFEKTDIDWKRTSEMKELYSALFKLRNEHKAFSRGKMIRIETPAEKNAYAFLRVQADDAILTVLNFSKRDINLHFKMPLEVASIRSKKILSEVLSDTSNTDILPFKDKVEMRLRLYGYKIYILTK
jgi:cyclomaltodextrinase